MDGSLSITQELTAGLGENGLDFRDDGECDFLRGLRSKIEARRREQLRVNREIGVEQRVDQLVAPFSRAKQADVAKIEPK